MKLDSHTIQALITGAEAQAEALDDPAHAARLLYEQLEHTMAQSIRCAELLREVRQAPLDINELQPDQAAVYFTEDGEEHKAFDAMHAGRVPTLYHASAVDNPGFPKEGEYGFVAAVRIFWKDGAAFAELFNLHLKSRMATGVGIGRSDPLPVKLSELTVVTA